MSLTTSKPTGWPSELAEVSVAELQAAWGAVTAGAFRDTDPAMRTTPPWRGGEAEHPVAGGDPSGPAQDAVQAVALHGASIGSPAVSQGWSPEPGESVLPVLGCGGAVGASTVGVALAEAMTARVETVRLIECGSPSVTGLGCATNTELGLDPASGWVRGTRGGVLIERGHAALAGPASVPTPSQSVGGQLLSVLDVGWDLDLLLASDSWLTRTVVSSPTLVVVSVASVRGMRRLEAVVAQLATHRALEEPGMCVAVVGPRIRRWPREVRTSTGPHTAGLLAADAVFAVPEDPRLAVTGLSAVRLPAPVLRAAETIAGRLHPEVDGCDLESEGLDR